MTAYLNEHIHIDGDPPCPACGYLLDKSDPPVPKLVHMGTYALYETPDGGRHLVYRRTASVDETGELRDCDCPDSHLPDIPPAALPLISSFLENGFPPPVLALLNGKVSPLKMMNMLKGAAGNGTG